MADYWERPGSLAEALEKYRREVRAMSAARIEREERLGLLPWQQQMVTAERERREEKGER